MTFLYPSQERQFFYLESSQTPFLGQMSLKRENKQISNLDQTMFNPFGKTQFRFLFFRVKKRLVFYLERQKTPFLGQIYKKGMKLD